MCVRGMKWCVCEKEKEADECVWGRGERERACVKSVKRVMLSLFNTHTHTCTHTQHTRACPLERLEAERLEARLHLP